MGADWTEHFAEDLWLKPDAVGADEAAFIKKALRLHRGQSVLDAPCGAGRIAIHLAHAGCRITGVDLRPSFTAKASVRFEHEKVPGRFIAQDLRQMEFKNEFHAAYSWCGSFGYFSEAGNLDVIRRYALALRQGGRLLVDQINRENMLRHFASSRQTGNRSMRTRWDAKTQRVESDWVVVRDGRREHNRLSIRLYTPTQMRRLFEQAGLIVEALHASSNGEPYRRSSKRLIVVGRKI
ncbi:MAG: class I SAM-dependent methyltransferase [bacterium]|nr:class I SAM-dependent methyltransferase [bacterium]